MVVGHGFSRAEFLQDCGLYLVFYNELFTSNKQLATSNQSQATSNQQRATSNS
jgi:hypothetical protein